MNLDLLKKLTRLANNNPNDNEANLAARKVCKMLEESNWSLPSVAARPTTYNDVKRSAEPEFKSKVYQPTEQQKKYAEEWFFRYGGFKSEQHQSPFKNTQKKEPKMRMLECTKCHKIKETGYVGNLYVCIDCYWEEYESKKGK